MSKPLAIIFDLDGTLYEAPPLQEAFHAAFVAFIARAKSVNGTASVEAVLTDVKDRIRRNEGSAPGEFRILLELGLRPVDWLLYSEAAVDPGQYLRREDELIATLRELKGVRKDVATNTLRSLASRTLETIGVAGLVHRLWAPEVRAGRIWDFPEAGKPSVDLYRRIADDMGVRPKDVVVFGDRHHVDLEPARACGMRPEPVNGVGDLLRRIRTIFEL